MRFEPAPFHGELAEGPDGGEAVWAETSDGVRIRLGCWPREDAAGTVLLFPGRTEYIEKYGRTAADLSARGYAVLAVDWRGQGLAQRLLPDAMKGHVGQFVDYQRDVEAMVDYAEARQLPRPFYLLAHSMGGCIGLRALVKGLPVNAAAFTGPMWGIRLSPSTRPAAWALGWTSGLLGRAAAYAPGTKPDSYVMTEPFESNLLTRDREMYEYMRRQIAAVPEFGLGGPTLGWLHAALVETLALSRLPSPDLPCLAFQGSDERIVDTARIRSRMEHWPRGTLRVVPEGEHEVLMDKPVLRNMIADEIAGLFRAHAEPAALPDAQRQRA
ncbi:alpha/beta fold hydrolase [Aquicoccus sp. SCR17]|nr:alpha/beta fold hydrolase [Carideicomes alvinocaridis]